MDLHLRVKERTPSALWVRPHGFLTRLAAALHRKQGEGIESEPAVCARQQKASHSAPLQTPGPDSVGSTVSL